MNYKDGDIFGNLVVIKSFIGTAFRNIETGFVFYYDINGSLYHVSYNDDKDIFYNNTFIESCSIQIIHSYYEDPTDKKWFGMIGTLGVHHNSYIENIGCDDDGNVLDVEVIRCIGD